MPAVINGVIFRQVFDNASSTYTYLVACPNTNAAILIDPVYEQVGACVVCVHSQVSWSAPVVRGLKLP